MSAKEAWYVVNREGERIAGPYRTQDRAAMTRLFMEQMMNSAYGLEKDDG